MTTKTKAKGGKPTHRLYNVIGEGKTAFWREIGAAWANQDDKGFSLSCEAVPLTGRIVMRAITERAVANGGQR
jgi:hypothetical protein